MFVVWTAPSNTPSLEFIRFWHYLADPIDFANWVFTTLVDVMLDDSKNYPLL